MIAASNDTTRMKAHEQEQQNHEEQREKRMIHMPRNVYIVRSGFLYQWDRDLELFNLIPIPIPIPMKTNVRRS